MKVKFVESESLSGVPEKLGGAIVMCYDPVSGNGDFLWTHTTSSMGIAYQTTADSEAKTRMSRLSKTTATNSCRIMVEGVPFSTVTKEDSPVSSNESVVALRPSPRDIPMQVDDNSSSPPAAVQQQQAPPPTATAAGAGTQIESQRA